MATDNDWPIATEFAPGATVTVGEESVGPVGPEDELAPPPHPCGTTVRSKLDKEKNDKQDRRNAVPCNRQMRRAVALRKQYRLIPQGLLELLQGHPRASGENTLLQ
jgi:hypothetical protein